MVLLALLACLQAGDLIEKLRSDQVDEREDAAVRLRALGTAALPDLDRAAKDPDGEVAGRARTLAGLIRNRDVFTPGLLKAFPGVDERLATAPDAEWTETFLKITNERRATPLDPADLAPFAASALRKAATLNEKRQICSMIQFREIRTAAVADLLADPADAVRRDAADAVRSLKLTEALPRLHELLRNPSPLVRIRIVNLLPSLGAKESIPPLSKRLFDADGGVRGFAAVALAKLEGRPATPKLLLLVKLDPAGWVRLQAVRALQEIRAAETVPLLVGMLDDRDPVARKGALEILEWNGARLDAARLARLLEDEDAETRGRAVRILGWQREKAQGPAIIRRLRDPDSRVRDEASSTLSRLGAREAIPELLRVLDDPEGSVADSALQSLVRLNAREAIPILRRQVRDPKAEPRFNVFEALGSLDAREAIPDLIGLLEGPSAESARGALIRMNAREAIPAIRRRLDSTSVGEKSQSALALALLGSAEGLPVLLDLLRHDASKTCDCDNIFWALTRLSSEGPPILLAEGKDPTAPGWHRAIAAAALARLYRKEAVPLLVELLGSDDDLARRLAVDAVGRLRAAEAVPGLVQLLKRDVTEHWYAGEALARIGATVPVDDLRTAYRAAQTQQSRSTLSSALVRLGCADGIDGLLERDSDWTDLNALRRNQEWRILEGTWFAPSREVTVDAFLGMLEKETGLRVEWPENPFKGHSHPRVLDCESEWAWRRVEAMGALVSLVLPEGCEIVLEEGRIRIVPREEALRLWKAWAAEKR